MSDERGLELIQPPVALGVDIGGTGTKVGLVDVAGHVYGFERFPTDVGTEPPDPFLARLKECVGRVRDRSPVELTGIGLTREAKAIRPDIPVILYTGHSDLLDEEKARQLGAYALLHKPVDRVALSRILRELFTRIAFE